MNRILIALVSLVLGTACSTDAQVANQKLPSTTTIVDKVVKSEDEWRNVLSKEQYYVLRESGTERSFTGKYWNNKAIGIYNCAGCTNPLFSSKHKYKSGTGWPSYYQPFYKNSVLEKVDRSGGWTRTEVVCAKCEGHLGHVFEDGPDPTGLRYCINSAALNFVPEK